MSFIDLTKDEINAGLWQPDFYWGSGALTYSVPDGSTVWASPYASGEPTRFGYGELSAGQRSQFVAAIELWDSYIAKDLNQVADGATYGEIRVAFTTVSGGSWGYAYSPAYRGGASVAQSGDVWIGSQNAGSTFAVGEYDFQALLHEIGHALGLKHSFDPIVLPAAYDSYAYTVMSYSPTDQIVEFTSTGGGGISYSRKAVVDRTPMVLDIEAVQNRYGADPAIAAGDSTYVFTDAGAKTREAIYDAGGIDTFDLSGLSRGSILDLRPGSTSDVNYYPVAQQLADLQAAYPGFPTSFFSGALAPSGGVPTYEWTRNVGIAFRTTIENAIGSSFADTIGGNDAANRLEGRGGDDVLQGLAGDDLLLPGSGHNALDGGAGSDTASYAGVSAPVYADLRPGAGYVGGALADTFSSIENLVGGSGNDLLVGDDGPNRLAGGGGTDQLQGFGGDDLLVGGTAAPGTQNQLFGGLGKDTVDYSAQTAPVYVELRAPAGYVGGVLTDLMNGVENAIGGAGADTLVGTDSDGNALSGGSGTDLLFGFGGDDVLIGGSAGSGQYNQLFGGAGQDTASYLGTVAAVYAELTIYAGYVFNGSALVLTDVYNSVESLWGGSGADTLAGDGGANRITGGAGADMLYGRAGADTFAYLASGDSSLLGGGYDTIADFQSGLDKIDLSALSTDAAHVLITSAGGSSALYGDIDVTTAGYELAIAFVGPNALTLGDIVF